MTMTAYGAVVLGDEGLRFHVATRTRDELMAALADYVAGQAPQLLWGDDAEQVAGCLRRGDHERAVSHYFATVGQRWDRERMHLVEPAPVAATAG